MLVECKNEIENIKVMGKTWKSMLKFWLLRKWVKTVKNISSYRNKISP